ncbi:MAG: M23 family metallopeptidase [Phycisphaerae bacterium]|nr:M23 family metallopeptidase [Phycisphaerae bacterium]
MQRRLSSSFGAAGVVVAALVSMTAADDAALSKRMAEALSAAGLVRIDGRDSDWKSIPSFSDPQGDATGNAAVDIVEAAIAPTADALFLLIRTHRRPLAVDHLYRFTLDFRGDPRADIMVGLSRRGRHSVWPHHLEKDPTYVQIDGEAARFGEVIEVRLDWRDLATALPGEMAEDLLQPKRSWLRVVPLTLRQGARGASDRGPAVASYYLSRDAAGLDGPLPMKAAQEPVVLTLPVRGQWYVSQGANGALTHRGAWAYDLIRVDGALSPARKARTPSNKDHHAFGQAVLSPLPGKIAAVRDAWPDLPPRTPGGGGANAMVVQSGDTAVSLLHLQQNSSRVKLGEDVAAGQAIAAVGNSGASNGPHLHLAAVRDGRQAPAAFQNVRVGLNPGPKDPWLRKMGSWSPREGFFVEAIEARANGPGSERQDLPAIRDQLPE